jgi:hypothetical protein
MRFDYEENRWKADWWDCQQCGKPIGLLTRVRDYFFGCSHDCVANQQKRAYEFLIAQGYTPAQAAYLIGTLSTPLNLEK